jgi:hypothetical protein
MVTVVVTAIIIAFGFGMVSNLAFLMILSDVNGALEPGRQFPWFFSSFYVLRVFSEHRRLHPASRRQRILVVVCGIVSLSAMMVGLDLLPGKPFRTPIVGSLLTGDLSLPGRCFSMMYASTRRAERGTLASSSNG